MTTNNKWAPTEDLNAFRQQITAFIEQEMPADLRATCENGQQPTRDQMVGWHKRLAAAGLLVPNWPIEWGGRGWSVPQQLAFEEAMALSNAPELNSVTFDMIGPLLARYGSSEQKHTFLPAIASGEQWWCQGYSEPNAGSDLASLTTQAQQQGDTFVVNGSKIWTSYAQYADYMFCLAKTDIKGKPQESITFFLIDMKDPGITVRPIEGIHGWVVFNEVFLDDVKVNTNRIVGQINQGWSVAKSLLKFERLKLARIAENKRRMHRARTVAMHTTTRGTPVIEQTWFRTRYARLKSRLIALEANAHQFIARQQTGETIGDEVSMLKLQGSQLVQAWEELIVDALGEEGLLLDNQWLQGNGAATDPLNAVARTASSRRFLARGYTIAGGSTEIQKNILAKKILGL